MMKTATITELRSDLASYINQLGEGPLMVMSRSRPAAVLIDPETFDTLMRECELLEDILDGRQVIAEYRTNHTVAVNAEEVFERLGH